MLFVVAGLICGATTAAALGTIYAELIDIPKFEGARGFAVVGIMILGAIGGPFAGLALAGKNVSLQRSSDFFEDAPSSRSARLLFVSGSYTLFCGMLGLVPTFASGYTHMGILTTAWVLIAIATSLAMTVPCFAKSVKCFTLLGTQFACTVGVIALWLEYG
ncbi:hypothetical protein [Rubripirellula obstinata]|uniref:hypothetical protein n=1 Tax=Rubripirellula obstinata TaxID=406547 RepID=UPI001F1F6E4E|nr:hypothetical protein [Rubripirellula obstinata]